MLFRKDIDKYCAYCRHSGCAGEGRMICAKHGIVAPESHCRAFSYDPLKRTPPRPKSPDFSAIAEFDFSL